MRKLLAFVRLIIFALAIVFFVFRLMLVSFFRGKTLARSIRHRQDWANFVAKVLNIKVILEGALPQEGVLLLPNHRSYIDGSLILPYLPCVVVIKADVNKWPIIGWGAAATGSIFVKRYNRDSLLKTRQEIMQHLAKGQSVAIFPEGTTHAHPGIGHLKQGAFHIAAELNTPVVPAAIEYQEPADAWVGSEAFLPHFLKCFGKWQTVVKLRFGEPLQGEDAVVLQQEASEWLKKNLAEMDRGWVKVQTVA